MWQSTAPPPSRPPVSIEQLLVTQNELMSVLVQNEARCGVECPQHHWHQDMNMSYSVFLVAHPPVFLGQRTCLKQITGSAPLNQNSVYYTT
jgi:hypothetical protein